MNMDHYESSAYDLHMNIVRSINNVVDEQIWNTFSSKVAVVTRHKHRQHILLLRRKFKRLNHSTKVKKKPSVEQIPDMIVNQTRIVFTQEELSLLNCGLKHVPSPSPLDDVIQSSVVNIESAIRFESNEKKNEVRTNLRKVFKEIRFNNKPTLNREQKEVSKTIGSLREKDCVYVKADKGNKIVILSREDYEDRMERLIIDSKFESIKKCPLNDINKQVRSYVTHLHTSGAIDMRTKFKMMESNPILPQLYGLPKIHKQGSKMRPIVSNVQAPTYKIAKWLVDQFKEIGEPKSFQVTNSEDAAKRINGLNIDDDEVLLSFDVESLFPSIPMDYALDYLEEHLVSKGVAGTYLDTLVSLTEMCMYTNHFQFRGKYFKLSQGCAMGNPLSPFVANVFMAKVEAIFSENALFPRLWIRYVDDIFAVVKRNKIRQLLHFINDSKWNSLKFTMELEENGRIPFLDLSIERSHNKISLGIFHKETATKRYITSSSCHPMQHKKAAFNSMVHRLINIPLTPSNFAKEELFIKEVATMNGFDTLMVDKLIHKFKRDHLRKNLTTLTPDTDTTKRRIVLPYNTSAMTVYNELNKAGYEVVFESGRSLHKMLGSTKDKVPILNQSGVYQVTCPDCDSTYIGQTRRQFNSRLKEHQNECNKQQKLDYHSAIAEHQQQQQHRFDVIEHTNVLKTVTNTFLLDAWESFYISTLSPDLNREDGPLASMLYSACV